MSPDSNKSKITSKTKKTFKTTIRKTILKNYFKSNSQNLNRQNSAAQSEIISKHEKKSQKSNSPSKKSGRNYAQFFITSGRDLDDTDGLGINEPKIKLKYSFCEKLLFLNLCEGYYKSKKYFNDKNYLLYYKGKKYLENLLDISTFLKNLHFVKMYINLRFSDKQIRLFENVSRPMLSNNYIGPMLKQSNLPFQIKRRLNIPFINNFL